MVTDSAGASSKATVQINLNDLNEAPVFDVKLATSYSVAENNKAGIKVATIKAKDADKTGQTVKFGFVVNDVVVLQSGPFTIDASTGVISVLNANALDFETVNSYSLRVRATDSATSPLSTDIAIQVTVIDINDAPQVAFNNYPSLSGSNNIYLLSRSLSSGTLLGQVSVLDADSGPTGVNSMTLVDPTKGGFGFAGGVLSVGDTSKLVVGKTYKLVVNLADGSAKPIKSKIEISITITP